MKRLMKSGTLFGLIASFGTLVTPVQAQPTKGAVVKVPFAFVAGNTSLPAGTYRIEMLTQGKPGREEVEVIALRGVDVRGYAAIVAQLGRADERAEKMAFKHVGGKAILSEVRVEGKSMRIARMPDAIVVADSNETIMVERQR